MARRKARQQRRKKQDINLLGVAEAVLMANVACEGLFNVGVVGFVTGKHSSQGGPKGYFPSNSDTVITLPELLGFDQNINQFAPNAAPSYKAFSSSGAMEVIKNNFQTNGMMMGIQLITIPVGFKLLNRVTRKPRTMANRLLKNTGLGVKV